MQLNASSPVFYLAFNNGGFSQRTCKVPAGKALFIPVMMVEESDKESANASIQGLSTSATTDQNSVNSLYLKIGDKVYNYQANVNETLWINADLLKYRLIQTLLLLILLITEFLEFYTAVLLLRLNIGMGEILALHSAVYEKADMERIPPDTAAYKVVEEIRDYSQLGGLKKEPELSRDRDAEILLSHVTYTNKNRCQDPLMNFQCHIQY